MNIDIATYGTKGLPKFGVNGGVDAGVAPGAGITEINTAFNNLVAVVKKNALPGNDFALWYFGMVLTTLHSAAVYCITGKPVLNG